MVCLSSFCLISGFGFRPPIELKREAEGRSALTEDWRAAPARASNGHGLSKSNRGANHRVRENINEYGLNAVDSRTGPTVVLGLGLQTRGPCLHPPLYSPRT